MAAPAAEKQPKVRAKLPAPRQLNAKLFFKDAFREALVGPRPKQLGVTAKPTGVGNSPAQGQDDAGDGPAWSELVSADTLEDEVKALQIGLNRWITTPGKFSSGGYRDARRAYTELATLFAVIGQYDGQVRWQRQAALARDRFARAAANAKVTSIQAFNDAKQRKLDLQDLVQGGQLSGGSADAKPDWERICARGPLMQRFTQSYDDGLAVWTANAAELKSNRAKIVREAELLRLFAVVLLQDGVEDSGDEDYAAYCHQLQAACDAVLQAVENGDHVQARKAASDIGKSCANCHEDYRG